MGRSSKCVIKGATASTKAQNVMPHDEFIDRIRKSFYFGYGTRAEEMEVSRPLAEYASELFSEPHKGHSLNRLNAVAAGSVHASPCSLIMALIYLDRLNVTDPGYARRITPQELFIVSMMISTKFYAGHDEEIFLSDWAEDGHMTEERLKQLELEFLCAIDWNIYISNEQFFSKLTSIEKTLARREGLRRGWLTYSELMQMLPTFTLIKFLLNNITVLAVSYAASVMTIAGAFFLASQIPGSALHRTKSNGNTLIVVQDDVMPASPATEARLSGANNATSDRQHGETKTGSMSVVTIASDKQRNTTCNALNVEVELLKLERQYREEALLEELRQRQNEITTDSRLTLPAAVQQKSLTRVLATSRDLQRNWFTLKEEYSDGNNRMYRRQKHKAKGTMFNGPPMLPTNYVDCFMPQSNCSSSLFWQLIGEGAQLAYLRLPWLWFKFM